MTNNINNNLAFKNAQINPAYKQSFGGGRLGSPALFDLPKGIVISNQGIASFLKKVNKNVSSPEQRLIMGVTALASQPYIDLGNKRVNEETRLMSFSRTLSKILVGTTVGVLVRKGCIKVVNRYTKMKVFDSVNEIAKPAKAAAKSFLSPEYVRRYTADYHKNYINALGTVSGILVSLFTNFIIDAPLTQILTNKLYSKVYHKPSSEEKDKHHNLLARHLSMRGDTQPKQVSFSGNIPNALVEGGKKNVERALLHKAEALELAKKYSQKMTLKTWFWSKVSANPGSMLMHTGAIGWAASSAAQMTGIALNDKIDSNKKKFLLPQEFADAVFNIALYYVLTLSVTRYVAHLFESGKIRIKAVMDRIEREAYEKRKILGNDARLGNIFDGKTSVANKLAKLTTSRNRYLAHKNGACILATLVASVISCNILTPLLRNYYAARRQDAARIKSSKINAKVFDLKCKAAKAQNI